MDTLLENKLRYRRTSVGLRHRIDNRSWCIVFFTIGLSVELGACSTFSSVLRNPQPLFPVSDEINSLKQSLGDPGFIQRAATSVPERNAYISERMYAIDLQYTNYEAALTHATEEGNLGSALINLGITGTTSVLNVPQTNKILSAIATGVTGASQAFDKDILLSQAIQDLQTQMRADRNTQGARILANMNCSVAQYPLGRALSDLELYYRAGTLASAQITLPKTVSNAEQTAQAKKDSVNPSPAVSGPAQTELKQAAMVNTQQANSAQQAAKAAMKAPPDESNNASCPAPTFTG